MAFLDSPRFPTNISFSSRGGPEYEVSVVVVNSGFEQRNLEQDEPLHVFDVSYGVKTEADLYSLLEFFHAVQGMTHEFRYKDWTDYKSSPRDQAVTPADQRIGTGDNSKTQFQLIKKYVKGSLSSIRTIKKPVAATVRVSLNNVEQTSGWSVGTATGVVTFDTAPGAGVTVKAGFEFDVPCRFDMRRLETSWVAWEAGRQDAVVKEVRL